MSGIVDDLRGALGESITTNSATLRAHCRDTWVLNELRDVEGTPFPLPLAVVEARSTQEVSRAMRLCREAGVIVVPYGGGSGVCGAIQVPEGVVVISRTGSPSATGPSPSTSPPWAAGSPPAPPASSRAATETSRTW